MSDLLVASGSVTLANLRLSLATGLAFVDFSIAGILSQFLNCMLILYDSAGAYLIGYIKAVGSGERMAAAKTLTSITKANPGIVTYSAGHGYTDGELIYFSGLTEMTSLNGKYRTLANKVGNTFQLGNLSAETAAETTGGACSEQVLTPGITGVTIVSAAGGVTRNWLGDGFNPLDANGYTYEIYADQHFYAWRSRVNIWSRHASLVGKQ